MTPGKILFAESEGAYLLKLVGEVRLTICPALEAFLEKMLNEASFHSIIVDLSETETIDSTSLGLLAKLSIRAKKQYGLVPVLISTESDITRVLHSMGFERVFIIVEELETVTDFTMKELPCDFGNNSEQVIHERVLDAHRTLMSLNDDNRKAFSELVKQLEKHSGYSASQMKTNDTKKASGA